MRKLVITCLLATLPVSAMSVSAEAAPPPEEPGPVSTSPPAPAAVPEKDRDRVLGGGWRASRDRAWTTSGDGAGLHVLVADAASGYAWRTLTTLTEQGFESDQWVGNACRTGSKRVLAVTYAPRAFTNRENLFERGAFTALVNLDTGVVTKLDVLSTLAYYSPGCGAADTVVFTQVGETRTRLLPVDAATAAVKPAVIVDGQLTSAVPTASGIVAADAGRVVRVTSDGGRSTLATTSSVPFALKADAAGGVVFLDHKDAKATVHRVNTVRDQGNVPVLAEGPLDRTGLTSEDGVVHITGDAQVKRGLPSSIRKLDAPKDSRVTGDLVLTSVTATRSRQAEPTDVRRDVRVEAMSLRTKQKVAFSVVPTRAPLQASAPTLTSGTGARIATAGSPNDPVEAERTCSVPRNDPRNQVMQPKPRQVEWAVDQAITDSLTVARPANWKNLGMPAYTPQGYFPPLLLNGGGRVPAQVFLGMLAQESNLWQAPGSVVPGVTGNPLIGNYYGLDLYDGEPGNDWTIRWEDADCGYGVAQVTDGMRRTAPGAGPTSQQRAITLDFASNVAAGLRILQDKWNQTRADGLMINNGDPSKVENWFYAVWAYNSGYYPRSTAGSNSGAWGVGWFNNPVNPNYPANRAPFLEYTYADAAHPQDWPYPEKVMGWAGHPVEVLESPGKLVQGYRAAWWNGGDEQGPINRARVKPPVAQFCDASNSCVPGQAVTPGSPAGPCMHRDSAGQYDFRCWYHQPSTWKSDCSYSCGNELLRFYPGYAYQDDGTAYPPACGLAGLPAGALIIDDQPDSVPVVRPGCSRVFQNQGAFSLDFGTDGSGNFPSKVDFHQLGAGFGGHFYYAHTRTADLRGNSMRVTGTWTLNRTLNGWARVMVHMPDHGAHTQQATYEVDLGTGVRTRVVLQRTMANKWVSLGSFPFAGTPKVRLSSVTHDGDDGNGLVESEDIAYDAVAFQPLPGKPADIVVSLGDSYSSGEGASVAGGGDYYPETDNSGGDDLAQNACHRSKLAWSRKGRLADSGTSIGQRADSWDVALDHHLIACSGAETENLLPVHTASDVPRNAFGDAGRGQYGELSQLDKGFLDEHTTLVTLSIGGNDAKFGDVLKFCLTPLIDNCAEFRMDGDTEPLRQAEPKRITGQVKPSVRTVIEQVKRKAPNARIVLMGYPKLFERFGACVLSLDAEEALWMNSMAGQLNMVLSEAANEARAQGTQVRFSDPTEEFSGKAVCGSPESVRNYVAGWNRTPGEEPSAFPSQQSFHPNADGQTLYADSLNSTLREFGI
ncbi:GDSL-type esterase/lipase family protein [Lentzea albidocapillata]|uniref:GDSL-like Lipase/Acylhydrolase family protein n=1 Tax=Lentzea albidocapillata TaxID=40571 RepID=A0A1W2FS33_9PSEU|nr:GDSL-type esterase/lipase family protein [Lentzea albidocapillata]SMD24584.1 GDSL-like Lipase/Acylhydrolase family protein [Lentzea albidocapillata]